MRARVLPWRKIAGRVIKPLPSVNQRSYGAASIGHVADWLENGERFLDLVAYSSWRKFGRTSRPPQPSPVAAPSQPGRERGGAAVQDKAVGRSRSAAAIGGP